MPTGARWTLALATIAASLAIAGCGDDDDHGGSEAGAPAAAALVPPDAVLYADAIVRPDGDQRENAESALGAVLGEDDPGGFISEQLQTALSDESLEFSYDEDIEPWLGERAAAFFLNFEEASDGAFVVETTDEDLARDSIERLIEQEDRVRSATYEGVEYTRTSDDGAAGIVDGYAVIGSEAGFEAAVDASAGESLADSDAFTDAVESAADDRLLTVYAEPRSILDVVVASGELEEEQASAIAGSIGSATEGPVVMSAGATDAGFFAEVTSEGEAPIGGASELIERLPDDAWAAFALADAGGVAGPAILGALSENDVLAGALAGLQAESDALEEFGASIEDAAGWFGGSNVLAATGALIFETSDESAAQDLLDGLQRVLSADARLRVTGGDTEGEAFSAGPADVPIEFPFVLRDGLLASGLGEQSIDQVFEPESSLEDSDAYAAAEEALGEDFPVAALLDFQALVGFFEGLNVADEPDLAAALPYLGRLDVFAAGSRSDDSGTTGRVVLRPQGTE